MFFPIHRFTHSPKFFAFFLTPHLLSVIYVHYLNTEPT